MVTSPDHRGKGQEDDLLQPDLWKVRGLKPGWPWLHGPFMALGAADGSLELLPSPEDLG